tara:strand:- start:2171 stop:2614 length:444 start_codon:yes stop_codon:yes gene_type:complete
VRNYLICEVVLDLGGGFMGILRYVGIRSLAKLEQDKVKTLMLKYMEKLDRYFVNYNCKIHLKTHDVEGRPNYSFHARIFNPDFLFSAKADDWDLNKTVHKLMKKVLTEAEHKFHKGEQKQQKFHPKKAKRGTDKRVKLKLRRRVKMI